MPCTRPLAGHPSKYPNVSGKRSLEFFGTPGAAGGNIPVPCGGCAACMEDRARQWVVRCVHEAKMHERNSFLTLTYDPAHLPTRHEGELTSSYVRNAYRDMQLFHKRVRKEVGAFRFYSIAEFGDKGGRLHWHGLYFGLHFPDAVRVAGPDHAPVLRSAKLETLWGRGLCSVGPVELGSVRYVVNYMSKPLKDEGVRFSFARMSRKPALGRPYYDAFGGDAFPRDECVIDGRAVPAPKRYLEWLEQDDSDLAAVVKEQRRVRATRKGEATYGQRLYGLAECAQLRESRREARRVLHVSEVSANPKSEVESGPQGVLDSGHGG